MLDNRCFEGLLISKVAAAIKNLKIVKYVGPTGVVSEMIRHLEVLVQFKVED